MLTFQISGITPYNDTVPINNLIESVVGELRKLRRMSEQSRKPIVVELANDTGRIKCTIVDPEELAGSLGDTPHVNGSQEWMVGYYVPTAAFLQMQEHTAVMDARTQELVATCGPSGDTDSVRDACLFAVSPKLYALCEQVVALTLNGQSTQQLLPELQAALAQVPATGPKGSKQTPAFE